MTLRLPTLSIVDNSTQKAFRLIEAAVNSVSDELDDLEGRVTTVESGVSSVTSGSSELTASPTTGDVVLTLDLSGYAPISHTHPESDITGLVADLAARPTGSGTAGRSTRWTGASAVGNGAFLDDGTNVSLAGTLTLSAFTQGSVLFAGAGGLVSEDNPNLFWDDTNNRLGVGTASPATTLNVAGTVSVTNLGLLVVGSTALTKNGFASTAEITRDADNSFNITAYGSSSAPELMLYHGRGTGASTTSLQSGDSMGQVAYTGATSSGGSNYFSSVLIKASATENFTAASNFGAKLEFYTTQNNSGSGGRAVRMTIGHDGGVTIAQTLSLTPMTAGSILFAGTSGVVSQSNSKLFWDNASNQLVVGAAGATKTTTAGQAEFTRDGATSASVFVSHYGTIHPVVSFMRGRGTAAATTAVQSGDALGSLVFAGAWGASATNTTGSIFISGFATENWTSGAVGSKLSITTGLNGTTTRTAKLSVENDGGITLTNSASAAVSAASELRLRYSTTGQKLQYSANAGAYVDVVTSAAAVGVANTIPKWTAANAVGLSTITDDGTTVSTNSAVAFTNSVNRRFAYFNTSSANYTVFYNSTGGTFSIGGAAAIGGAPSVEAFRINPVTGASFALGTLESVGDFSVNGSKLTVAAATGNTAVAGDLSVAGSVTLGDTSGDSITVNGGAGFNAGISVNLITSLGVTDDLFIESRGGGNGTLFLDSDTIEIGATTSGAAAGALGDGNIVANGSLSVSNTAATISSGSGSPEGVVTAAVGSLFMRTDGGAGTTLYVKESGAGNTGWVAK